MVFSIFRPYHKIVLGISILTQEKSAAEWIFPKCRFFLEISQFSLTVGIFNLSSYLYLNLAAARSIFKHKKWATGCISISFYHLGNFRIFEGPWEFFRSSSRPCHHFALFFKLSHMPGDAGHGIGGPSKYLHWASIEIRPWAVAQGPGQLPSRMHEPLVATGHV